MGSLAGLLLLLLSLSLGQTLQTPPDSNKKCPKFVADGYCEVNPKYMATHCATSYEKWRTQKAVTDFYSIVEEDIFGGEVLYEKLRGKYVYMINVASEDGNSMENYKILEQLSKLRSDLFEIVIFPCNQFGDKEPRSNFDIAYFAQKLGFRGIIMSKGDVNGVNTRPTFQYLKANSRKNHIYGNFDGKYFLDREGKLEAFDDTVNMIEVVTSVLTEKNMEL